MNAEQALLAFMARPGYSPLRLEVIVAHMGGNKADLARLRKSLPRLIKTGTVVLVKGHLLALPKGPKSNSNLVEGTILFRASGSARVVFEAVPGQKPREPLHIDSQDTGVALHGDRVMVKINPTPYGPRWRRLGHRQRRPRHQPRPHATHGDAKKYPPHLVRHSR